MKMKALAMACGVAVLGTASIAQAEFSANIGVTSNYIWRGVTQTDDSAAVQGGIDWAHDSGFYLGTWASNVDFPVETDVVTSLGPPVTTDTVTSSDAGAEVDFYGGFAGEVGDFGYDLGLIYYYYPIYDDVDFYEVYGSGSWRWITLGINYTLGGQADKPSQFRGGDYYYYGSVDVPLPMDFSIGGTVGRYDFKDDGKIGVGDVNYTHFDIYVGKSVGEWGDFALAYSKAGEEAQPDDKGRVYVSWNKSF